MLNSLIRHKEEIVDNGFTILENIYSADELGQIIAAIDRADKSNATFRKSAELFAIRQFLKEIPETISLIFNEKLKSVICEFFGENYFPVKSIYFDKPEMSNWYVSYHQDLTISVDKKTELKDFSFWTNKQNQFAVQPPLDILKNIFTIRIHLDDTNENNGALRVIPGSHTKNIHRPETIDLTRIAETICKVNKGGIMIMKPLLMHSSGRTTNHQKRRVIHIEFSDMELPEGIKWAERLY